jgi:hypothetical protein
MRNTTAAILKKVTNESSSECDFLWDQISHVFIQDSRP